MLRSDSALYVLVNILCGVYTGPYMENFKDMTVNSDVEAETGTDGMFVL